MPSPLNYSSTLLQQLSHLFKHQFFTFSWVIPNSMLTCRLFSLKNKHKQNTCLDNIRLMDMSISLLSLFKIFLKELAVLTALNYSPPPFCPKHTLANFNPHNTSKTFLAKVTNDPSLGCSVYLWVLSPHVSWAIGIIWHLISLSFLKQNFHFTFKSLCYPNFPIPLWLFLCYLLVPFLLSNL